MSDIDLFDIFKDDAGMTVAITTSTPLRGTGSLAITRTAGLRANMMPKVGGKFTSGRANFLVGFGTSPISNDLIGIAFQTSQRDLTGGAGTGYVVDLRVVGAGLCRLHLARYTAGMPTKVDLAQSANFAYDVLKPQALPAQVTWQLDIANLGGINIVVKRGPVADYSLMTNAQIFTSAILSTTDINTTLTTTVLQTSQGEGPVAQVNTTGAMMMDALTVVPLFVGGA